MTNRNNTFEEIIAGIEKSQTVLILTHVIADGDTLGSSSALCRAIENLGKTCHIFTGEKLQANLRFLEYGAFKTDKAELLDRYDMVIAVDCSDTGRFENRMELFERADITANIDHHKTNTYYADLNHVEADAAAAGEIMFRLIKTAGWNIDSGIAEALYTAIVTDTGQFQYSSTTAETHRIAAELLEAGIDLNEISVCIYQSDRKNKYILQGLILQTLEFSENDRFAMAYADQSMYDSTDSEIGDSDGVVELIRNIDTVEVACFVKEVAPGMMKVGFRAKRDIDVAAICAQFGGGGHSKAAGCSIRGDIQDVRDAIYPAVRESFRIKDGR